MTSILAVLLLFLLFAGISACADDDSEQPVDAPDQLREELEAELASFRDPILTAEVFGVEEIIDPRDTRPLLVEFAHRASEIVAAESRGPKSRGMRP